MGIGIQPAAQCGQAVISEESFVVVRAKPGGVDASAIGQEYAGLFPAGLGPSNEFHFLDSPRCG
jgi:hypothetical protein